MSVIPSRRQRERRDQAVREAQEALDREVIEFREAIAFIQGPDSIEPGQRVAELLRVSNWDQDTAGQEEVISEAMRECRAVIVKSFARRGVKGYSEEWFAFLEYVFRWCAERGVRVVVVSELSRLVRSPEFGRHNLRAQPTAEQLERIRRLAEKYGITVVSIHPPDEDGGKERGWQSRRGSNPPGRPTRSKTSEPGWRKARKEEFQGRVFELLDSGKSYRKTAKRVSKEMRAAGWPGITYQTVAVWHRSRQNR